MRSGVRKALTMGTVNDIIILGYCKFIYGRIKTEEVKRLGRNTKEI